MTFQLNFGRHQEKSYFENCVQRSGGEKSGQTYGHLVKNEKDPLSLPSLLTLQNLDLEMYFECLKWYFQALYGIAY